MSAVYAKYVSTPIHPVDFPQKNQFPNKPGFPLFKLIILDWYPYVSLFPDLLCNIASSVSVSTPIHPVVYKKQFPNKPGFPLFKLIRFNAHTPRRISTKKQFPNKPGFPLFKLIILDWYPYVSLFPDLLCNIASSVSGLRKIRFNAHTPRRFSTKKSVPKQTRIPVVQVNNFRLVSLRFSIP